MSRKPIEVTFPPLPFDQLDPANGADPAVLQFIRDFYDRNNAKKESREALRSTFMCGYCWYFAHMLQLAFDRGGVYWCAPNSHFVWCAEYKGNIYAYDVEGVSIAEADYYIPEDYLGHYLDDFKHVKGREPNATEDDVAALINNYRRDFGLVDVVYPFWWHKKVPMPTEQEDALWRMTGCRPGAAIDEVDHETFKRVFDINRHYLYHGDFTAPSEETNFEGSHCYIGDEGMSGACVTADGWLTCLFSNSSRADFLGRIAPYIEDKIVALTCITSEETGDKLVNLYKDKLHFIPCATTVNDAEKFASHYGTEFARNFISKWGNPKHVFMTKKNFVSSKGIPHICDYFDAKKYVDNILKGADPSAEQKKYATG